MVVSPDVIKVSASHPLESSMNKPLRRRAAAAAFLAAAGTVAVTGQAPAALAAAGPLSPALTYDDCPALPADLPAAETYCSVIVITGGRLKIGKIDQEITSPIKLTFLGYSDAMGTTNISIYRPLKSDPIRIKGGLFGVTGSDFLPVLQIHAKPVAVGDPVFLPPSGAFLAMGLKLKVQNLLVGDDCTIGSDADPLKLNVGWEATNPPAPNTPITGEAPAMHPDDPTVITATVVDNSFAVPQASNCGPFALFNPIVDYRAGTPSAAGTNTAVFDIQWGNRTYSELGTPTKSLKPTTVKKLHKHFFSRILP
ncbi:hypothetical protein GCM10027589_41820 [Actinocorallia lasiicapitis]